MRALKRIFILFEAVVTHIFSGTVAKIGFGFETMVAHGSGQDTNG
jgi:hypothetical protein